MPISGPYSPHNVRFEKGLEDRFFLYVFAGDSAPALSLDSTSLDKLNALLALASHAENFVLRNSTCKTNCKLARVFEHITRRKILDMGRSFKMIALNRLHVSVARHAADDYPPNECICSLHKMTTCYSFCAHCARHPSSSHRGDRKHLLSNRHTVGTQSNNAWFVGKIMIIKAAQARHLQLGSQQQPPAQNVARKLSYCSCAFLWICEHPERHLLRK